MTTPSRWWLGDRPRLLDKSGGRSCRIPAGTNQAVPLLLHAEGYPHNRWGKAHPPPHQLAFAPPRHGELQTSPSLRRHSRDQLRVPAGRSAVPACATGRPHAPDPRSISRARSLVATAATHGSRLLRGGRSAPARTLCARTVGSRRMRHTSMYVRHLRRRGTSSRCPAPSGRTRWALAPARAAAARRRQPSAAAAPPRRAWRRRAARAERTSAGARAKCLWAEAVRDESRSAGRERGRR
eukprot:scaffold12959_cov28-Tisochrysis_lutea.AAC.1